MAAAKMQGERSEHTWQPTALVNELYLELVRIRGLGERNYGDEEERAALRELTQLFRPSSEPRQRLK